MGERAPYSRVYWSVVDDPKFTAVYDDDRHLATWLRLLIAADAIWPASPTLPVSARKTSVQALVDAGLIDLLPSHRYRVHGLDAERNRRSRGKGEEPPTTPVPDDEPPNKPPTGNQQVPDKSPETASRAGDALLGSSGLDSSDEGVVKGEADALDAYYRLTGSWPTPKIRPWLVELADNHGEASVSEALAAEWMADSDRKTFLGRVSDRLEREAHESEKRRAVAQKKADEEERRRIASMPEEQRTANLKRFGEMMAEAGLAPRERKSA